MDGAVWRTGFLLLAFRHSPPPPPGHKSCSLCPSFRLLSLLHVYSRASATSPRPPPSPAAAVADAATDTVHSFSWTAIIQAFPRTFWVLSFFFPPPRYETRTQTHPNKHKHTHPHTHTYIHIYIYILTHTKSFVSYFLPPSFLSAHHPPSLPPSLPSLLPSLSGQEAQARLPSLPPRGHRRPV